MSRAGACSTRARHMRCADGCARRGVSSFAEPRAPVASGRGPSGSDFRGRRQRWRRRGGRIGGRDLGVTGPAVALPSRRGCGPGWGGERRRRPTTIVDPETVKPRHEARREMRSLPMVPKGPRTSRPDGKPLRAYWKDRLSRSYRRGRAVLPAQSASSLKRSGSRPASSPRSSCGGTASGGRSKPVTPRPGPGGGAARCTPFLQGAPHRNRAGGGRDRLPGWPRGQAQACFHAHDHSPSMASVAAPSRRRSSSGSTAVKSVASSLTAMRSRPPWQPTSSSTSPMSPRPPV